MKFEEWRVAERARRHPHVEFGRAWTSDDQHDLHRVAWVPDTGEVYTVDAEGQVEVFGHLRTEGQVEEALEGWTRQVDKPGSLYWARTAIRRTMAISGVDELAARRHLQAVPGGHPSLGRAAKPTRNADELAAWERRLVERERGVEAREAAVRLIPTVEPRWSLPAGPVAEVIVDVMHGTGDPVDIVAKGLGIEAGWARQVIRQEITEVDLPHVSQLCDSLHCSPFDLWGADDARGILHAYGPELWPRFIEPLDPRPIEHEQLGRLEDLDPPDVPPQPEM